jgi:hypothetical protein
MRKRIFIVSPGGLAPETDKRHDICVHDGSMSVHDCYGMDKYEIVAQRQSLAAALIAAARLGSKRTKVI